jgi:serine/threonine-protein kinase RsbW
MRMAKITPSTPESGTMRIANTREQIERAEQTLMDALKRRAFPDASAFALRLALEEGLVNAFRHGHKNLPPGTTVEVCYSIDDQRMIIDIIDQGPGFKPEEVRDPTLEENLELPSGRGLLLMRAYMAEVEYKGRGNHLHMVYQRPAAKK